MDELQRGKAITIRAKNIKQGDFFGEKSRVTEIHADSHTVQFTIVNQVDFIKTHLVFSLNEALTVTRPRSQLADVAARLGAHARPPLAAGYSSQAVRLSAPSAAVRWFMNLEASERGAIVTAAWLETLPALERMTARRDLGLK